MSSTLTLATLRERVRMLLGDSGGTDWPNARLESGIRLALAEYSRAGLLPHPAVQARQMVSLITPPAGAREVSLATLVPEPLMIDHAWYPYDAADPAAAPAWVRFGFENHDGVPWLFLLDAVGDGASALRLYYRAMHSLAGLDGAAATTFGARDEQLIVLGAAGWTCEQRAAEVGESPVGDEAGSGPHAGGQSSGRRWLTAFREGLKPRRRVACVRLGAAEAPPAARYDPTLLDWVAADGGEI